MDIRSSGELPGIIEMLKAMAIFEVKVSELYSICASTWQEDCQFWLDIWKDEISHALYVNNIIEIVKRKPEVFETGRPFSVAEVQAVVSDIVRTIDQMGRGLLSKYELLHIAGRLEGSFLESKYNEIVKTDDMEYNTMIEKIITDTRTHKWSIVQRIKEVRATAEAVAL